MRWGKIFGDRLIAVISRRCIEKGTENHGEKALRSSVKRMDAPAGTLARASDGVWRLAGAIGGDTGWSQKALRRHREPRRKGSENLCERTLRISVKR